MSLSPEGKAYEIARAALNSSPGLPNSAQRSLVISLTHGLRNWRGSYSRGKAYEIAHQFANQYGLPSSRIEGLVITLDFHIRSYFGMRSA